MILVAFSCSEECIESLLILGQINFKKEEKLFIDWKSIVQHK
jgi:hypothetical protein